VTGTPVTLDVTEAAGFGQPASIGATIVAPGERADGERPVVVFARPGAGFTQGYYTERLPGRASSQADWHAARGWIVVAVDHLGIGASTPIEPGSFSFGRMAAAAAAADHQVLDRLAAGTLVDGLAPLTDPVVLGMGQSMGGCLTIVQQAHHRTFDGIAVLGYSAVHTHPPVPPGEEPAVLPWAVRDPSAGGRILNEPEHAAHMAGHDEPPLLRWLDWQFYGDEVDPATFDDPGRWRADRYPGLAGLLTAPGVIATEAAAIRTPVLVAMGARDVVDDIKAEPHAYRSTTTIDLFVCPRMGHMHNFAPTAELLWHRIHRWGEWVRDLVTASPA
jgi:pimeloyl-ACP methyl ester carboxylesterase